MKPTLSPVIAAEGCCSFAPGIPASFAPDPPRAFAVVDGPRAALGLGSASDVVRVCFRPHCNALDGFFSSAARGRAVAASPSFVAAAAPRAVRVFFFAGGGGAIADGRRLARARKSVLKSVDAQTEEF